MSMHVPAAPGWWQRNWKWCVPVLAALLLSLFAAFVFGLVALIFGALRSSTPYQHALAQAKGDPAVVAALGDPIHAGWFVQGNISVDGAGGEADLRFRSTARALTEPFTWLRRSMPAHGAMRPWR